MGGPEVCLNMGTCVRQHRHQAARGPRTHNCPRGQTPLAAPSFQLPNTSCTRLPHFRPSAQPEAIALGAAPLSCNRALGPGQLLPSHLCNSHKGQVADLPRTAHPNAIRKQAPQEGKQLTPLAGPKQSWSVLTAPSLLAHSHPLPLGSGP